MIIGFDPEACAIGVRARGENTTSPSYDFARRIKNDWIRIGAKDFVKYLAKVSGIDFLTKAKQFIAEYDPETETLIVVVDEQHLKVRYKSERKRATLPRVPVVGCHSPVFDA